MGNKQEGFDALGFRAASKRRMRQATKGIGKLRYRLRRRVQLRLWASAAETLPLCCRNGGRKSDGGQDRKEVFHHLVGLPLKYTETQS